MKKIAFSIALASAALAGPAMGMGSIPGGGGHHGGGNHGGGSTEVPEPGMLGMFGLGLAGIVLARRRRKRG